MSHGSRKLFEVGIIIWLILIAGSFYFVSMEGILAPLYLLTSRILTFILVGFLLVWIWRLKKPKWNVFGVGLGVYLFHLFFITSGALITSPDFMSNLIPLRQIIYTLFIVITFYGIITLIQPKMTRLIHPSLFGWGILSIVTAFARPFPYLALVSNMMSVFGLAIFSFLALSLWFDNNSSGLKWLAAFFILEAINELTQGRFLFLMKWFSSYALIWGVMHSLGIVLLVWGVYKLLGSHQNGQKEDVF